MKTRFKRELAAMLVLSVLVILSGCGGGGSNSGGSTTPPPPPPNLLTITSPAILPGTLQSAQYNYTLQAANGSGALTWSIAPVSSTTLFIDGLAIDASTGVLSGTANFGGTGGFTATVKDSASPAHTTSKNFTITAGSPLVGPAPQTFTFGQYNGVFSAAVGAVGGVQPLQFTVTSGVLPSGVKLNTQSGVFSGSAVVQGHFPVTVTVQDSFSPPEIVTAQVNINILAPPLNITPSLPVRIALNRPFNGRVIVTGGTPPYTFTTQGSLPQGIGPIDSHGGQLNGTPTAPFNAVFTVNVTDSSPTPQSASANFQMIVDNPRGRNDSVSTARPSGNGQIFASISPYIDPPTTTAPGDSDYYKFVSVAGAIVHVETFAVRNFSYPNLLDTVIEIVDGNNTRLTTCRQPGDSSTNFSSACLNDDISASPHVQDSALDFKVPGTTSSTNTFYVHVLDFRGDARPDMQYQLVISGVADPLAIVTPSLFPAARGLSYSQQINALNGSGAITFSVVGGSLPPGISLDTTGTLSGPATADGTYTVTVQAKDSVTPPQTVTKQFTINVVEPIKISSSATWPDACLNKPYSFAMQTSGGIAPYFWSFDTNFWMGLNMNNSTGVFVGTPSIVGAFNADVGVTDGTGHGDSQTITVKVKSCP